MGPLFGDKRFRSVARAPALSTAFLLSVLSAATAQLYEQPTLIIDPGMHTAPIEAVGVDAAGSYAVTGSIDKTVRVWSPDGAPASERSCRRAGSSGGNRPGANGARSTCRAPPSRISSLIASPVAGALSMPQTLWPVAT
jgi:hypothetical protein